MCYDNVYVQLVLVCANLILHYYDIIQCLALQIFVRFIRVALGGPFLGYLVSRVVILWLTHVFNDGLVESTITLAATYITFYICESLLGVSGVLAVVTLGIEINSRKTSISPEVEVFLHRYGWVGIVVSTYIVCTHV